MLTEEDKNKIKNYLLGMEIKSISSEPFTAYDTSLIEVIVVCNGLFCPIYLPERLKDYV